MIGMMGGKDPLRAKSRPPLREEAVVLAGTSKSLLEIQDRLVKFIDNDGGIFVDK